MRRRRYLGLYHERGTGAIGMPRAFWREEYRLNARIARYPKPFVAIMDGIVMGGGVGLSAHGQHRVVTERSMSACPRSASASCRTSAAPSCSPARPGELGTHLALTGGRLGAADAIYVGFADHYVPVDVAPALLDALRAGTWTPRSADVRPSRSRHPGCAGAQRGWIDACYSADTVA